MLTERQLHGHRDKESSHKHDCAASKPTSHFLARIACSKRLASSLSLSDPGPGGGICFLLNSNFSLSSQGLSFSQRSAEQAWELASVHVSIRPSWGQQQLEEAGRAAWPAGLTGSLPLQLKAASRTVDSAGQVVGHAWSECKFQEAARCLVSLKAAKKWEGEGKAKTERARVEGHLSLRCS